MNQGQFDAIIGQLQLLNQQIGQLLDARPHVIVIRGDSDPLAIINALKDLGYPPATGLIYEGSPAAETETETPQGANLDPSYGMDPAPAGVIFPAPAAAGKFKKAKGGG